MISCHILQGAIYLLASSPDGRYLASGELCFVSCPLGPTQRSNAGHAPGIISGRLCGNFPKRLATTAVSEIKRKRIESFIGICRMKQKLGKRELETGILLSYHFFSSFITKLIRFLNTVACWLV